MQELEKIGRNIRGERERSKLTKLCRLNHTCDFKPIFGNVGSSIVRKIIQSNLLHQPCTNRFNVALPFKEGVTNST